MPGNKWWSTKIGAKLLSDLIIFSILPSEIPLDMPVSVRAVLVLILKQKALL